MSAHRPATPAWPPKSAPRLFVDATIEQRSLVRIVGSQAHYLHSVMRVSEGDSIVLCDDRTGEWQCEATASQRRSVEVLPIAKLRDREDVPDIWLCPALLKRDRFDLVLEKATELGARAIQPLVTRRCVADKLNAERARAVCIEAAEQCARTALPALLGPIKLTALLKHWPANRTLFFADEIGGEDAGRTFAECSGPAAILIGPEGGFDQEERCAIRHLAQARPISLGPRILRAETAAIASLALWMTHAGDWGKHGRGALRP